MHVNFFYWEAIPFNELVIILSYPPSDSEVKTMFTLGQGWQVDGGTGYPPWEWVVGGDGGGASGHW